MNKVVNWLTQSRDWLDARGRGAWLAVMVLGFILFWPLGLGTLFYMIWSGRMGCSGKSWKRRQVGMAPRETGNAAFDEYREETIKRLEEERTAFVDFLEKLRRAKDKSEFDQFMDERGRNEDAGPATA